METIICITNTIIDPLPDVDEYCNKKCHYRFKMCNNTVYVINWKSKGK